MAAHPDGSGSSWTENLDVDQPHGLDYRSLNDLRIGVRKRISHQHTTFADNTVGGLHKPGKVSVLKVDTSANLAAYLTDPSCAEFGMACATGVGKLFFVSDATDEWVILPIWGSICKGGDITWSGDHRFDGTVTFKDGAEFSGAVSIDSSLQVKGQTEFTAGVLFDDSVAVTGALVCGSNANITGDFSGTGTAHDRIASAWCSFCGNLGATLRDSYNVASVARNTTGDYSVTFTTAMADANYVIIASLRDQSFASSGNDFNVLCYSQKTTGFNLHTGPSSTILLCDISIINVVVFGG